MAKVKICGVNTPEALRAAADAGADWVGFNFFPPSPRYVAPVQAALLTGGPSKVGLFVNPDDAAIEAVLAQVPLDVLQIHAGPDRAAAVRARFGLPVWHVVGVSAREDLPDTAAADAILLDAKAPPGAALPGGNALSFDWSLLAGWQAPSPWLLAGGLTPDTVAEAIRITGAPAVDVASGVERVRGIKDAGLIRAFVAAAHAPPGPDQASITR